MADPREMLVAALSGGAGSVVAKLFTYPLEISKTRLMNKREDQTSADCIRELFKAGWYVGFKEKVFKSFVQKFVFFYLYEAMLVATLRAVDAVRKFQNVQHSSSPGTLCFLASGYLGEALGIPLFTPLEYEAVQVQNSPSRENAIAVIRRTVRTSGTAGFYRGWQVYLLCALQPMVQFSLVERAKAVLSKGLDRQKVQLSAAAAFWVGALTKAVASTLTYPINLGRVKIQSDSRGSGSKETASGDAAAEPNVFAVLRGVVHREGVLGLYKGLFNEIVEGLLGAALLLVVKEQVTASLRKGVHAAWKR